MDGQVFYLYWYVQVISIVGELWLSDGIGTDDVAIHEQCLKGYSWSMDTLFGVMSTILWSIELCNIRFGFAFFVLSSGFIAPVIMHME